MIRHAAVGAALTTLAATLFALPSSAAAADVPAEEAVFFAGQPVGYSFVGQGTSLYAAAPDGTRREVVGVVGENASVSPTGAQVAFALPGADRVHRTVYVAGLDGRGRRAVARTGAGESLVGSLDWSPD